MQHQNSNAIDPAPSGPFERTARTIEKILMAVSVAALAAMVIITVIDVALRYIFRAPLGWAYLTVSDYLNVAVYFGALAMTEQRRQNVSVDTVTRLMPSWLRKICLLAGGALTLILVAAMFFAGLRVFVEGWSTSATFAGYYELPRWPSQIFVPLGFGALLLRITLDLFQAAANVIAGKSVQLEHYSEPTIPGTE